MAGTKYERVKDHDSGHRRAELSPLLGGREVGNILDCMNFILGTGIGDQELAGVTWVSWQLREKVGLPTKLEDPP